MGNLIQLAIAVLIFAGMWKAFEKAKQPGWAAIIPFYNLYIILTIAGKPVWWIVLMLIPIVNIVIIILTMVAFAQKFGKGGGFGVGLALLGFIFFPLLGFGDAQYIGSAAPAQSNLPPTPQA